MYFCRKIQFSRKCEEFAKKKCFDKTMKILKTYEKINEFTNILEKSELWMRNSIFVMSMKKW